MFAWKQNTKEKVEIPVTNYQSLKATVIHGVKPGKCLVVTAGVHGCEYVGVLAAKELLSEIEPTNLCGSVIIIPIVNESGFYNGLKQIVQEDGMNLNRVFPGDENGSESFRIAAAIEKYIYPFADFLIDLHCGDVNEKLIPLVFYPVAAGERIEKETCEAAKALNVSWRVDSRAKNGLYSWAAQKGIPALLLEYGCQGVWQEYEVSECKKSVYNLMKHMRIVSGEVEVTDKNIMGEFQKKISSAVYVEAPSKGLWFPKVKEGQIVEKGTVLGELQDLDGNIIERYYSAFRAVVMYYTLSLGVNQNDPLIAYGEV